MGFACSFLMILIIDMLYVQYFLFAQKESTKENPHKDRGPYVSRGSYLLRGHAPRSFLCRGAAYAASICLRTTAACIPPLAASHSCADRRYGTVGIYKGLQAPYTCFLCNTFFPRERKYEIVKHVMLTESKWCRMAKLYLYYSIKNLDTVARHVNAIVGVVNY